MDDLLNCPDRLIGALPNTPALQRQRVRQDYPFQSLCLESPLLSPHQVEGEVVVVEEVLHHWIREFDLSE